MDELKICIENKKQDFKSSNLSYLLKKKLEKLLNVSV